MDFQAFQVVPLFVLFTDQRAPLVLLTKTSITLVLGEVAAGDDVRTPPRDFHADQAPFQCV
jgi:hypothetical protein